MDRINKHENVSGGLIAKTLGAKNLDEIKGVSKEKLDAFEKLSKAAEECAKLGWCIGMVGIELHTHMQEAALEGGKADLVMGKVFVTKKLVAMRSPGQLEEIFHTTFKMILDEQSVQMVPTKDDDKIKPDDTKDDPDTPQSDDGFPTITLI